MSQRDPGRTAQVFLGALPIGSLTEDDGGHIEFRLTESYLRMPRRPVLGQWSEDRAPDQASQRGDRAGMLPGFFANLIPEGDLRLTLDERLGVASGDDFGLLCAVGRDLPGAVTVQLVEGDAPALAPSRPRPDDSEAGLRFSLAGVQLKFSMLRSGQRFAMPGRDQHGDWIAKIAYDAFADLPANEWVTMEWARRSGFDVPVCELRPLREMVDLPQLPQLPQHGDATAQVFLIQRYDRKADGTRIHQEDFQQIVGRQPEKKYDDMTYDGLVALALRIGGSGSFEEMLRRLALVVATGNNDAHMKNWSVLYPDGITAQLCPLYDQVFTARWPQFSEKLALKLGGSKAFAAITLDRFAELARRVGESGQVAARVVPDCLARIADAWNSMRDHATVTPAYRAALARHWRTVPLLQPHALLI